MVLDTKKRRGGWYNIIAVHASTLLDAQIIAIYLINFAIAIEWDGESKYPGWMRQSEFVCCDFWDVLFFPRRIDQWYWTQIKEEAGGILFLWYTRQHYWIHK